MKGLYRTYVTILLLFIALFAKAQIVGFVTDAVTGDTISYPSASYKGQHIAVSGDATGKFIIEYHNGWALTISAVGYQSKIYNLKADQHDVLHVS